MLAQSLIVLTIFCDSALLVGRDQFHTGFLPVRDRSISVRIQNCSPSPAFIKGGIPHALILAPLISFIHFSSLILSETMFTVAEDA